MSAGYWRINPVAMIASAVALISLFLPWWGIYELVGPASAQLGRWGLWNPPGTGAINRLGHRINPMTGMTAGTTAQTFAYTSLIVLLLVLVAASLSLAGSLTVHRNYLIAGLALSILAPIVYAISLTYITTNYCLTPACITGPLGHVTQFGVTYNWGFETGFYTFIAAIIVMALALSLNNTLARTMATHRATATIPTAQPTARNQTGH
jgi:hypothetical protein